jgi:hypothetical protein
MMWFGTALWPSLTLCTILYILDYYLTIAGARLYRRGARQILVMEGSYELNPRFQKDIDQLRWFSGGFVRALISLLAILSLIWWLAQQAEIPWLFTLYVGFFVGLELAIQRRHLQNLFMFRSIVKPGAAIGQITYTRALILKQSSFDMLVFALLFATLSFLTWSLFLLGGAFGCLSVAIKHAVLARKTQQTTPAAEDNSPDLRSSEMREPAGQESTARS